MLNTNVDIDNAEIIIQDIGKRNDGRDWKDMNYTDKYNMIICCRTLKKNMDEAYKLVNAWADIPLEYIQNERIRQVEADKYSLEKLIR